MAGPLNAERMPSETPFIPSDPEEARFVAEFEAQLEDVVANSASTGLVRPLLHQSTMAFAILNGEGAITWCDARFLDWVAEDDVDALAETMPTSPGDKPYKLAKSRDNRPIYLALASVEAVKSWSNIDLKIREQLQSPAQRVVIAVSLSHMADEVEYAARALGLSNLEAKVCAALFAHGNIKRAATHATVSYHTARKALASAMKTLGVSRQTSLIRRLSQLATVSTPSRSAVEQIVIDVFGLQRRDAKLIHLLCEGYSRSDAARICGLSASVAKDRFSYIFQELEIESATDLPTLVIGAFASAVLLHDAPPLLKESRRDRAPLRLIRDAADRVIAVNDYGPRDGKPVLIAHSSLSTRHPFQSFVRALQSAGFRPFTIDRPGFGLSDDLPELNDRFETGVEDVARVCEALGFEKTHVVTRGGAFHVLALARRHPHLLDRVVVINPDLLQHDCSQRKGRLGLVRLAFDRYPGSVERVANWTSSHLSPKRLETIIRSGIGDAPADLQSFADGQNMGDYVRSLSAFSTGRLGGFIREQRGYVLQTEIAGLTEAKNWTIVTGESDPIHDVDEILDYWTKKAPNAQIEHIPAAGRFISLSHPNDVIDLLS